MVDWHRFTPSDFEYDFERDKLSKHSLEEAVERFFSSFEIRRNKRFRDRYQLIGDVRKEKTEDYFSAQTKQGRTYYHRLANMSEPKQKRTANRKQEAIDELAISLADDDSPWGPRIHVKRPKATSLAIPGELAARAAFLAKLHHESGVGKCVERIARERVELKERAFVTPKKELAS